MRNKIILLASIVLLLLLTSCSLSDSYSYDEDYYPTSREKLEEMDWDDIMEYVVEEIPFDYMLEYYGEEQFNDYVFDLFPNMYLVVDDMETLGLYEEIMQLYEIADKVGYYPSAILGEYFMDESTSVIHATDGDCLSNMRIENRQVVSCGLQTLWDELNDGDVYLDGCTTCDVCIGK